MFNWSRLKRNGIEIETEYESDELGWVRDVWSDIKDTEQSKKKTKNDNCNEQNICVFYTPMAYPHSPARKLHATNEK